MTSRARKVTLIVVAAVLSPFSLVAALLAMNAVNPMALTFLTKFTVVNETHADIWVTPIGVIGQEGRRVTLRYSLLKRLSIPGTKDRGFHIAAGSSREFVYDSDDIQFCEILVHTADGVMRVMPTGLHPTEGQYRTPEQDRFVVRDLAGLESAGTVQLRAMEQGGGQRMLILYGVAAVGLLPPVLLLFVFARRRHAEARKGGEDGQ
jgi:hypothetical protein